MMDIASDPRYHKGIEFFNECEYFEAHEIWEELWQEYTGEDRTFLQGLIQVAVCLHHFVNGNTRGARKLFRSSTDYLEPYRPQRYRLDVDRLLSELAACCREIIESEEEYPRVEIPTERIPEIRLVGE